jgi:cell division protein ZapB
MMTAFSSYGRGVESDDLKKLESRIEELLAVVERLRQENQSLRSEHNHLNDRHVRLAEKTRVARERIESMIGRLKALERSA